MISLASFFASSIASASPIPDDAPVTQQSLSLKIILAKIKKRLKNTLNLCKYANKLRFTRHNFFPIPFRQLRYKLSKRQHVGRYRISYRSEAFRCRPKQTICHALHHL